MTLGVGFTHHPQVHGMLVAHRGAVDFIELICERAASDPPGTARAVAELGLPVVLHCLSGSPGSLQPLDRAYLDRVADAVERYRPLWVTEHLSMSRAGAFEIDHLSPVAYNDEVLDGVTRSVTALRERLGIPVLIENIASYFGVPGSTMTEAEFLARLVVDARCELLLDLNNLHATALNLGFSARSYLERIPLASVREIHIAGGHREAGLYVDSHDGPVEPPVWDYLRYVCERVSVPAIVLERDRNFPAFGDVLAELEHARRLQRPRGVLEPAGL